MKQSAPPQSNQPVSSHSDLQTSQQPVPETNRPPPTLPRDGPVSAYNKEELVQLLAILEGELQARDIALAVMRSEQKVSSSQVNAQFLKSLQSDVSNMNVVDDSENYIQLNSSQFRHLNRLVEAQKECQKRYTERLLEIEDQHARQLFELRDKLEETEKSIGKTKQGVCAILEEQVAALKAECTRKQEELDRLDGELKRRDSDMEAEKERQKTIVLFMLSERKSLLSLIHQMRMKMKDLPSEDSPSTSNPSANIISELKKQLRIVCEERNGFSRQCNNLQAEKANLINVIHNLEEDIISLKANSFINKPTEIGVGGYVVVNKAAINSTADPHSFNELNNTGTVRFNKSKGPSSFPTKSFEVNYQNSAMTTNLINGNVHQRPYTTDGSNLPRPSSISTSSANSARAQPPAMGVRGSQMRNTRPTMGVAAQQQEQQSSNVYTSQFPTTAADIPGYGQGKQVRVIPIDHQIAPSSQQPPQPSNIIHVTSDRSLTKRSTSLPRKMSNEGISIPVKSPNLPSSPSKIRPPSQNHATNSAPHFQPPIPQRVPYEHKQTGHTHIS